MDHMKEPARAWETAAACHKGPDVAEGQDIANRKWEPVLSYDITINQQ